MLGFYLVLPVFSPYVDSLEGSTPLLVGMAVGVYGLTQTLFQVPFGALSDKIGRRPVLTAGLLLFAAGSIVCAVADTALVMVGGRLIQGMGAIASVAVAMVADSTRDTVRTKAMAMLGVAIGGSFAVGLILGPWISHGLGIPIMFWATAGLCLVATLYLWVWIPEAPQLSHHDDTEYSKEHAFEVLLNRQLLILNGGTFNLHMVLTCIFVTVPFLLAKYISHNEYWQVFVPIMGIGFPVMLLGARISDKPGMGPRVAILAKLLVAAALAVMALTVPATVLDSPSGFWGLVIGLGMFVVGFALLEPLYPALLTHICQQTNRGTAIGIFNMSQFSGAFVGGLVSGAFIAKNLELMFFLLAGTSVLWSLLARRLEAPKHLATTTLALPDPSKETHRRAVRALLKLHGVEDVAWERKKQRLMVRYDEDQVDAERLRREMTGPAGATVS